MMPSFAALRRARVAAFALVLASPAWAGGTIHRQLLAEPESLDPQFISGSTDYDVVDDLFEGLTAQAADGTIIPALAQRWEISTDRLRWVFHLRPGLVWSDGSPLTAGDFVYGMRRAVDPKTASPYAAALAPFKMAHAIIEGQAKPAQLGVAAPDDVTLVIDLAEPTPFLPGLLAQPIALPLPHAAIERWGSEWTRPGHMVNDGPFVLESWTPQSEILLARNPKYRDAGSVALDKVDWLLGDDRRAALRRYRGGELDSAALAAEDFSWAKTQKPAELRSTNLLATRYLVVNQTSSGIGADAALREALSLAIDRDLLVAKIDTRGQRAAWTYVPPGMSGYAPQAFAYATMPPADRVARARALWGDKRRSVTLLVERDDIDHHIAEALSAMWQAALPIDVTLQENEWRVFNAAYHERNFTIALTGWYADYADPWNFLANWRSEAGPLNAAGYHNPAFDEAMNKARDADGAERFGLLEQAERVLLVDHVVLPLEFVVSQNLVSPRVKGWEAGPFDMHMSRFMSVGE
jgi:oligopeptide transport system substrate-binding protein